MRSAEWRQAIGFRLEAAGGAGCAAPTARSLNLSFETKPSRRFRRAAIHCAKQSQRRGASSAKFRVSSRTGRTSSSSDFKLRTSNLTLGDCAKQSQSWARWGISEEVPSHRRAVRNKANLSAGACPLSLLRESSYHRFAGCAEQSQTPRQEAVGISRETLDHVIVDRRMICSRSLYVMGSSRTSIRMLFARRAQGTSSCVSCPQNQKYPEVVEQTRLTPRQTPISQQRGTQDGAVTD